MVDGGSGDNSALIAREHADLVLHCDRGRARQMNLGAERAEGDWLWFLHADCGRVVRGHIRALKPARGRRLGRCGVLCPAITACSR